MEARVGIERKVTLLTRIAVQSQLPHSQPCRMTGYVNACKIGLICAVRQVHQNSSTTHEEVRADSFIGELLALLLALIS